MKLKLLFQDSVLFDSTTDEYKAVEINLTEQVNTTNSLTFTLPTTNPNKDAPQKLIPGIELWEDDVLVFEGRVLYTDDDIVGNRTFTCEGSLAYLLDSIVRPNTTQDTTIQQYLANLITQHNSQVEESKQFQVGTVTVTNSTDNVYRIDNDYANTLTVIQEKLVNRLGGYLRVRLLNGVRYLDYLESYDTLSNQKIEFKKNILDLSNHISAENVITALIPLGAKDEASGLPLTIESVNDGKDYIYDQTAVNLFGWIYGTQTWNDVTLAQNLLTKAEEALEANIEGSVSISITAFDMSLVDADIDKIYLGDSVEVVSQPHDLDKYFIVKKREKKYMNPADSSITLDTVIARNTDQVTSADKTLQEAVSVSIPNQIQQIIDYQTQLITGGKGGYVVFGMNDEGQPEEIFIMDQPTTDAAVNIIRMNKNGIGFSNSGINGPYTSAWTIDGKFSANFIATGELVGITIRGNTIIGGTISGTTISGTTINGGTITGTTINGTQINGGTITGATINGGTMNTTNDITVGRNINMATDEGTVTRNINFGSNARITYSHSSSSKWNQMLMYSKMGERYVQAECRSTGIDDSTGFEVFIVTPSKTATHSFGSTLSRIGSNLTVFGNLSSTGTKNRMVQTVNYGKRLMNAVESADAFFEDFGTAMTDAEGFCEVRLDDIFLETVNTDYDYYVFLTPYSDDYSAKAAIYTKNKHGFIVCGTPYTRFDWRVSAKQRGYERIRMEVINDDIQHNNADGA